MAQDPGSNEDLLDESGENLTQRTIGEGEDRPADVAWDERRWGETEASPQEGEEGTEPVA